MTPRPVLIRVAKLSDVPALVDLERRSFRWPGETFNRRQIRALLVNPRAVALVAAADGRCLGWAVGLVRRTQGGRAGRLYGVAVHPEARGRGIGRDLVERALRRLLERNCQGVCLEVRQGNRAAIPLYERLGFVRSRALADYYGPGRHGWRMVAEAAVLRRRLG